MIGQTISHYRIVEKIGEGGMGVVYKAADTKLQRAVALKFLPAHFGSDDARRKRFFREATAASSFDHPNICTIHEIGETDDGRLFIAMAYYLGETVEQLIAKGPLPIDQAVDIASQVAKGLAKAHQQGVTHRDIKPANLMLTKDGTVKILDFGLAKSADDPAISSTSDMLGTLAYMSPEQMQGAALDHRTDLWSLGVVMYEMLTGQRPFQGRYPQEILYLVLSEEPQPMRSLRPQVSAELERIVSKAMAKRVEARHQEARVMLDDLILSSQASRTILVPDALPVSRTPGRYPAPSIAVMPFENLSSDKEAEYFSDGLTDELINALAHVPGLRVVSRTSAFEFKGKPTNVQEIGARLKVASVLEGSVRKAAQRVRISARLINVEDGYQIWAERYDREISDIFEVQDEIALTIVNTLKVELKTGQYKSIATRYEGHLDVYDLYLKGRFHWNQRTEAGFKKAVTYFFKCVAQAPDFALGYTGLADYYAMIGSFSLAPPDEVWPKAKEAAQRALKLDDGLAEVHVSLAYVQLYYEWDWKEAERQILIALKLNPGHLEAHVAKASFLIAMRRLDEAVETIVRAQEIDPLSVLVTSFEVLALVYSGQCDQAIDKARAALDLEPNYAELYYGLGIAYQEKGRLDEAAGAFEEGCRVVPNSPLMMGFLGGCYGMLGEVGKARSLLERLREQSRRAYVAPVSLALIHIGLGDLDEAFDWLQKACETRDALLSYLKVIPNFQILRSDSRYKSLCEQIHLGAPTGV